MGIFDRLKAAANIGRPIIVFSEHGCQAHIHEFEFVGIIEGVAPSVNDSRFLLYEVKVLKDQRGEARDRATKTSFEKVPAVSVQDLGGMLIHYW